MLTVLRLFIGHLILENFGLVHYDTNNMNEFTNYIVRGLCFSTVMKGLFFFVKKYLLTNVM